MASDIKKSLRLTTLLLVFTRALFILANNLVQETSNDYEQVSTATVLSEEHLYLELIEPEEISYLYKIKPAKNFGVLLNFTLTNVELVPAVPAEACSHLTNSMLIYRSVALVERGGCSFVTKAVNAERAGAKAVVIMDNNGANDDTLIDMVDDDSHQMIHISAFFMLGKDGFMIRQCLQRHQLQYALINIPINSTQLPFLPRSQPPWTIWS